jgi:hypothetical protein
LICSEKPEDCRLGGCFPYFDPNRVIAARQGRPRIYRMTAEGTAQSKDTPTRRQIPGANRRDPSAHRPPASISPPIVLP